MTTTLYAIKERQRQSAVHIARPEHFVLDEGTPVDPALLLEVGWTPYCLDDASQRVLFVQTPADVDLSQTAFTYSVQYMQAQRVMAVPYAVLTDLTSTLPVPQLVFIHSTGRCGSTLLSQVLKQIDNVYSLSEPDIYTNISKLRIDSRRDKEFIALLKACTLLLYPRTSEHVPKLLSLKFRGMAVNIMDLLHEAFPDAHTLFMYRQGLQWARSMYRFCRLVGFPAQPSHAELQQIWQAFFTADTSYLYRLIDPNAPQVMLSEMLAPFWTYHLEYYLQNYDSGMPLLAVRYEEFGGERESILSQIFDFCGIPQSAVAQALHGFDSDSQEGTMIGQDAERVAMSQDEVQSFVATLAKHPRLNHPDLLLPDQRGLL